jgi:hypothetical protein
MEIKESYNKLIESDVFKTWKEKHNNSYLFIVFTLFEKEVHGFEFIYLDTDSKETTNFEVQFKVNEKGVEKTDKTPTELIFEDAKITFDDALEIANKSRLENYAAETIGRKMVLLENQEGIRWNITFFTASFKTINFKVNAADGSLLDRSISTLFHWDE